MLLLTTNVIRCGGRFGSFAFAEGLASCVGTKANVPNVRLAKIELKKMCGWENKKYWSVGKVCRLTFFSDWNMVSMLVTCQNGLSLCFCLNFRSVVCCLHGRPTIGYNGLQIGDGRAFQHRSLFGELNFRLPQNCQAETKPRLLPMCCCTQFFYTISIS